MKREILFSTLFGIAVLSASTLLGQSKDQIAADLAFEISRVGNLFRLDTNKDAKLSKSEVADYVRSYSHKPIDLNRDGRTDSNDIAFALDAYQSDLLFNTYSDSLAMLKRAKIAEAPASGGVHGSVSGAQGQAVNAGQIIRWQVCATDLRVFVTDIEGDGHYIGDYIRHYYAVDSNCGGGGGDGCANSAGSLKGEALVFTDGPLYNSTPERVCLGNLGEYRDLDDGAGEQFTNPGAPGFQNPVAGIRTGGNSGYLRGRYVETNIISIDEFSIWEDWPNIPNFNRSNNDFRVDPRCSTLVGSDIACPSDTDEREAHLWSTEAHAYYFIDKYRSEIFNPEFILSLGLDTEIERNLLFRQFRPDSLDPWSGVPTATSHFRATVKELIDHPSEFNEPVLYLDFLENQLVGFGRTKYPFMGLDQVESNAIQYDPEVFIGDYAGHIAHWVIGDINGFKVGGWFDEWPTNNLEALNDGLSHWTAYHYSGRSEVYRDAIAASRSWSESPCDTTGSLGTDYYSFIPASGLQIEPCDRGYQIDNVMMHSSETYNDSELEANGVFPFQVPTLFDGLGPGSTELSAIFFSAVFYDIAQRAGLGDKKADKLFWKTISIIGTPEGVGNSQSHSMNDFGENVMRASRLLWPDLRYEEDIRNVLSVRGINLDGNFFKDNLVATAGPTALNPNGFYTLHPVPHYTDDQYPRVANNYGLFYFYVDEFTFDNASPSDYLSIRFSKYSNMGPCDYIEIRDGSGSYAWDDPESGELLWTGEARAFSNKTLLLPNVNNKIRMHVRTKRCSSEVQGAYAEDVNPFGARIVDASPNGFGVEVNDLGWWGTTKKKFDLNIFDPSNTDDTATYTWELEQVGMPAVTATGLSGDDTFTVMPLVDEPFTLRVTRSKPGEADMIYEVRENARQLGRESGQGLVVDLR